MGVAVAGGASLIRTAQERTPVLLVAESVQPGETITDADLRVAEVSLAAGVDNLPASARGEIVGRVAAEPLWEGKMISRTRPRLFPPGTPRSRCCSPRSRPSGETSAPGTTVAVNSSAGRDRAATRRDRSGDGRVSQVSFPN